MQVNDVVIFSPRAGETAEGIVTRVWDKPASDPYVTVLTDESPARTFVRFASALTVLGHTGASPAEYAEIVAAERAMVAAGFDLDPDFQDWDGGA